LTRNPGLTIKTRQKAKNKKTVGSSICPPFLMIPVYATASALVRSGDLRLARDAPGRNHLLVHHQSRRGHNDVFHNLEVFSHLDDFRFEASFEIVWWVMASSFLQLAQPEPSTLMVSMVSPFTSQN
jgi:hypothetical protein